MKFEFDANKSQTNLVKHGIDFEEAKLLWLDSELIDIKAKTIDEPRTLFIGKIGSNHWSAITTLRNEKIRIISVRRARLNEIELYENE